MSGTVTWTSLSGAQPGNWSVPANWSTSQVPAAGSDVVIGPGITPGATLLAVTATNEAAGSLLIRTPAATLAVVVTLAGTFAIGGALDVAGGTLLAQGGTLTLGTLQEGGWPLGDALVGAGSGGSIAVGGGVTQATGGTLTLTGAILAAASATMEGDTSLGSGADAAIAGLLSLGLEGSAADPSLVAAAGTLTLAGGSTLTAARLDLLSGSTIGLDAGSGIAVGGAGFVAGAVAVAAGSTLLAPSGTIGGNLALAGVLDASFPFAGVADAGSELDIAGTLTGTGRIDLPGDVGTPGTIEIGRADGFTGTVDLASGTGLILDSGGLSAAPVHFLGATIDLRGQAYSAAATPGYDATSGLLAVGAATLDVGKGLAAQQFATGADPFGGTLLRMVDTATWQGVNGTLGGDWGDAAGWSVGIVPNGDFTAEIGPGLTAGTAWTVTATNGTAADLVLDMAGGTLALAGSFALADSLALQGGVLLAAAATLAGGGAASVDGGAAVLLADAGSWQVGGVLDLGSALVSVAGGGNAGAADVTLGGTSTLAVDATGTVLVGEALPVAGAVAVGSGATLAATGAATIAADLVDDGLVLAVSAAGSLLVQGNLLGSGMLAVTGSAELAGTETFDGVVSLAAGGELRLDHVNDWQGASLVGSGTVLVDSTLALAALAGFAGDIELAGGAVLALQGGGAVAGARIGLPPGATIDLPGEAFSPTLSPDYDPNTGLLSIGAVTLAMGTLYTPASFVLGADGHGGTQVQLNLGAPTWVESGGTAGGQWSQAAHWNTGSVPGAGADVQIGPHVTGTTPWSVTVAQGASADNLTLDANTSGTLNVASQPLVLAGTLAVGSGTLAVGPGGTLSAASASLAAGAAASLASGTIALGGAAAPAGVLTLDGGATLSASGSSDVAAGLAGAGAVVAGGTLRVGSVAGFTGTIAVEAGDLVIATGALGGAQVHLRGTLDLPGIAFSGQTLSYDPASGVAGIAGMTLDALPGQSPSEFAVTADPAGGLEIIAPCYAAGTRILCAEGERPVELLRPGDRVVTATGRLAPVRWVGWTTIDLLRHPAPRHAAPVRIRADALAPGRPVRDLRVSPDHALLLGGRLVPARLLCNGATIFSEPDCGRVSYVHVELDRHDVMLAEGVAAESYLDTGNRGLFAGESGERALFPDLAAAPAEATRRAYAGRGYRGLARRAGAQHARLLRRAEALGWRLTAEPALLITADMPGTAATPFGPDGLHLFLPPGAREVRFTSRSFIPDTLDPRAGDGRRLGVALGVRLDRRPLAASAYEGGWFAPLPRCPWRWTDGDACIRLAPRAREVTLTIKLMAAGARYWVAPEERGRGRRPHTRVAETA